MHISDKKSYSFIWFYLRVKANLTYSTYLGLLGVSTAFPLLSCIKKFVFFFFFSFMAVLLLNWQLKKTSPLNRMPAVLPRASEACVGNSLNSHSLLVLFSVRDHCAAGLGFRTKWQLKQSKKIFLSFEVLCRPKQLPKPRPEAVRHVICWQSNKVPLKVLSALLVFSRLLESYIKCHGSVTGLGWCVKDRTDKVLVHKQPNLSLLPVWISQ